MSDLSGTPFDRSDPNAVARTERFVDALANREPIEFGDAGDRDPGDRALAGLLENWRDEMRSPPGQYFSEHDAVAALHRGLAAHRRARRRLTVVGSLAATVLAVGGFGAIVADTQPGDTLYGMHTMLFGEPPSARDDRIALSAKTDLDLVAQMITRGQWDEAQDKLAAVSDRVQAVNDSDRKQDLIEQVNVLTVKVANRDPNATLPPSGALTVTAPTGP